MPLRKEITSVPQSPPVLSTKKINALYLSVNVFSTKILIEDIIFTTLTKDETAIFPDHPSHAKVELFAVLRQFLHF